MRTFAQNAPKKLAAPSGQTCTKTNCTTSIFTGCLPEEATLEMPSWWRPGMPFVKEVEDLKGVGVSVVVVVVDEQSGSEADKECRKPATKECGEPANKTRKRSALESRESQRLAVQADFGGGKRAQSRVVWSSAQGRAKTCWVHSRDKDKMKKQKLGRSPMLTHGEASLLSRL
eukprot:2882262-Amphidinium_carterae.1